MSSLLSTSQIASLTGQFDRLWDTMSQFRSIVVNKQPLQTISNVSLNPYPGYSDPVIQENITYTPVSGVYPCIAMYDKPGKEGETFQETKVSLGKGKVRIKVKPEAANFINNTPTVSIILDGNTYTTISDDGIQNYLGLMYHYYLLERTD